MYPDPRVVELINADFIPARAHIKRKPEMFERFGAKWTPTQIVLDPDGHETHRIEGFLPVDDFLAQLSLGLAKVQFHHKKYAEARRIFLEVYRDHPSSGAAPEACYWAGVCAYKDTNDAGELKQTAQLLESRYPESEWTRKASVWR